MGKEICGFCEGNKSINKTDYQFSIPLFSRCLMITDKKKNREYLYGISYCPKCGRKLEYWR